MKAVVVLSGGLDSTTALYKAMFLGYECYTISFNYGQKHKKELEAAKKIADLMKITHKEVDITSITDLISNSALTSNIKVPEGHYASENMKITVVPNRNMIMYSIAIGYAVNIKANVVVIGVHAGDHFIYPDCRPEFIKTLSSLAYLGNEGFCLPDFKIYAPFLNIKKQDIVSLGNQLKVPFQLTWSCYKGGNKHCGVCGTDNERKEAFRLAKVPDPTEYEGIH